MESNDISRNPRDSRFQQLQPYDSAETIAASMTNLSACITFGVHAGDSASYFSCIWNQMSNQLWCVSTSCYFVALHSQDSGATDHGRGHGAEGAAGADTELAE